MVTIPEAKIRNLPKGLFNGVARDVVVLDTGNYYPRQRDGRIDEIEPGLTESRWVERQLGRPVVKAFNNIYPQHLMGLSDLRRDATSERSGRSGPPYQGEIGRLLEKIGLRYEKIGLRRDL